MFNLTRYLGVTTASSNASNPKLKQSVILLVISWAFVVLTFGYGFISTNGHQAEAASSTSPSCSRSGADIYRLYQAYFGRKPDEKGLNYWLDRHYVHGSSLSWIADFFSESSEFNQRYSRYNNQQFVDKIYRNVFGRNADQQGRAYWLQRMDNGLSRSALVQHFAFSDEMKRLYPLTPSDFCAKVATAEQQGFVIAAEKPGIVYLRQYTSSQRIHLAILDFERTGLVEVSPGNARRKVGSYAEQVGAQVAINGNWFTSSTFDGPSVSDGVNYGGGNHNYTAPFGFGNSKEIYHEMHAHTAPLPTWVTQAVSGHPTLTYGGENQVKSYHLGDPTIANRHPRTAIGSSSDNSLVYLMVVEGRLDGATGMNSIELANTMLGAGAYNSVMLDGGGSSTMWLEGLGVVNRPSDGSTRSVGNQIVFEAAQSWR